jgi:hypothetical protein
MMKILDMISGTLDIIGNKKFHAKLAKFAKVFRVKTP